MKAAKRRFLQSFATVASILIVSVAIVSYLFISFRRNTVADGMVQDLLGLQFDETPGTVEGLIAYKNRVVPQMQQILQSSDQMTGDHRRAMLGLLPFEPEHAKPIVENLIQPDCGPEEFEASLAILREYDGSKNYGDWVRSRIETGSIDPRSRFRAFMCTNRRSRVKYCLVRECKIHCNCSEQRTSNDD